jgi:predicted acyltransferase
MELLAMCYWLIDVKGRRAWAWPFLVFGTNAITVFFASGIVGRLIGRVITLPDGEGGRITLMNWLYQRLAGGMQTAIPGISPSATSLTWAVLYVLFWLILLIPLYRRRIFIKV